MKPALLMKRLVPRLGAALALAAALPATPLLAASPESEEYREEVFPVIPTPEAADSLARAQDSARADSASKAAQAAVPGEPDLPNPSGEPQAPSADTARLPTLALLPTAAGRRGRPGEVERETAAEALRLGAEQSRAYRVLPADESARPFGRYAAVPSDCFAGPCAARAARTIGADLLLVSELSRPPAPAASPGTAGAPPDPVLTMALVDKAGKVRKAVRARACPGLAGPIPFAQQAVWRLLLDEPPAPEAQGETPGDSSNMQDTSAASPAPGGCSILASVEIDSGAWRDIPWLNPRDTVDGRLRFAAAGTGLLAAGLGLAWIQGQLLGEDDNSSAPTRVMLSGKGARSWMRGFFAVPDLGARYAALGGAGLAHVDNSLAVILNPAGLADAEKEDAVAAKRNLPDGTPSLHLSYAGPLAHGWNHGVGILHEGDDLANETTLQAALAQDWGAFSRSLAGLRTGAGLKLYLAKVGEEGTGLDRSTGHSLGFGLDLGLKLRLSERITGALSVRDAVGFLKHSNTFTGETYWEFLPPEYRVGAAYRVDQATLLVLDGQKGLVADQVDHVRLGGERTLFRFLALRAGLHQAFGRQAVRKLAVGFGLDSEGLNDRDRPVRARIALDYAYDFGLGADEPLGTGQQFSISISW